MQLHISYVKFSIALWRPVLLLQAGPQVPPALLSRRGSRLYLLFLLQLIHKYCTYILENIRAISTQILDLLLVLAANPSKHLPRASYLLIWVYEALLAPYHIDPCPRHGTGIFHRLVLSSSQSFCNF